jgi:uncharacterized protein (DUF1501 family)
MQRLSRRTFLAGCAGVGAAGALVSTPIATWADLVQAADDRPLEENTGILVLLTMYGGNDGLNTLIPYTSDAYHDARPDLAYDGGEVLKLDADYGLNPGMPGMAQRFHDGSLAIVRGVGYPEPDRSHFRSMDIWQSASLDNSVRTGWIGRWLDSTDGDPLRALHFGPALPQLTVGEKTVAAVYSDDLKPPADLADVIPALSKPHEDDSLAMTMVCNAYAAATRVNQALEPMFVEGGALVAEREQAGRDLAAQLSAVAACISAGVPARVYSVELDGFDTHADERETQQKLLQTLDSAVTSFINQVSRLKHGKNVVLMAYSEFGRRVAANASDGTDHGTAGPVFIAGQRVRGGFYGDDPSLTDLADDNLKFTTDFRDVYDEILADGIGSDPEPVVGPGRKPIGFLSG